MARGKHTAKIVTTPTAQKDQEITEQAIEQARLTPRQLLFVRHFLEDPRSATLAAIKAGYSPKGAHVQASRLLRHPRIRSILADHFADHQSLLSSILVKSLKRLDELVETGSARDALKAISVGLAYTKLAADIMGIIPQRPKIEDLEEQIQDAATSSSPSDIDSLIGNLEAELERLRDLRRLAEAGERGAEAGGGEPVQDGLRGVH